MAGSALKRLMAEFKRECCTVSFICEHDVMFKVHFAELSNNPPEGIAAGMTLIGRISMDNIIIVAFFYLCFQDRNTKKIFSNGNVI